MTPGRLFYGFDAEEVFDPKPPIEEESLLSWIARTAIENELPNITTIMRDVGQLHRNRFADVMRGAIDVDGLAIILGESPDTIWSMCGEDLDEGAMRFLGATIRAGDVHTKLRRFAPAALSCDKVPFYRSSWLIRTFPVCTDSWQTLRSSCSCGTEQTWSTVSSLLFCEECDQDLRELPSETVPDEFRPGLTYLADILFGRGDVRSKAMRRLPPELRKLDPGDIYELALLMVRIIDPAIGNPRKKVWRDKPIRLALALARAGDLLPEWPKTPWLALGSSKPAATLLPRCAPLVALYRILAGAYRPNLNPAIGRMFDDMRLALTIDGDMSPAHLAELNEAEQILQVNKNKIRAARAVGTFSCHFVIRGNDILPAYHRAELALMNASHDWPSAATVGKTIGLPPYGVEQLCAIDDLIWTKAPHRTLREGLRIDPNGIEAFESSLRRAASGLSEIRQPVAINAVMRGIGGREKPWASVLRRLLEGEWPYALVGDGRVVRDIRVSSADAQAIRDARFKRGDWSAFPFSEMLNQDDACDILNVTMRNRLDIERYKFGERRGAWLYDRKKLAELASSVITAAELGSLNFMQGMKAAAAIRRSHLEPLEFGFRREGAVAAFAAADAKHLRHRIAHRNLATAIDRYPVRGPTLDLSSSSAKGP